jgi:hypothetical protein
MFRAARVAHPGRHKFSMSLKNGASQSLDVPKQYFARNSRASRLVQRANFSRIFDGMLDPSNLKKRRLFL